MSSGVPLIFGGAAVNEGRSFGNAEQMQPVFTVLEEGGVHVIDTAALYGKSEEILGKAGAGKRFTIDTKHKGGFGGPGNAVKKNVIGDAENSKKLLGVNVDIFYIHAPDGETPIEDTLAGVNEVHKSGFFKRFGLSNYKAEDVEKIYNHCKEKGYITPSVYQGNYNAVARSQETLLFPTLRKLGMSFYAYSPIAGGFLTKSKQEVLDGKGRFDPNAPVGALYRGMYGRETVLEALDTWDAIAKEEGVTRADLAYRWVRYNSALEEDKGDAVIIGASSVQQLKETLGSINAGPLSKKAVGKIEELWKTIEHEAPLDNFHK